MRKSSKYKFLVVGTVAIVILIAVTVSVQRYFFSSPVTKIETPSENQLKIGIDNDEKLSGDYSWGTAAGPNKKQYEKADWQVINYSVLEGFSSELKAVEKKSDGCQGDFKSVLRLEGCLCQKGYWVEISQNGKAESITTESKLKTLLLPIDSEEKAVSLVVMTKRDLVRSNGIPTGRVLAIEDGYLVQLLENNTCGCNTHVPTGVIYKVNKSGEVGQVAAEVVKSTGSPEFCVD
jgi:hypothetical protein